MREQISALFVGIVMSVAATSASAGPNPWRTVTKDVDNRTPGCVRIYLPDGYQDFKSRPFVRQKATFHPFDTTGYFVSQFPTNFCGGPSKSTWRNLNDSWIFTTSW